MTAHEVERLAELLGTLPPAPAAWVQAAQELPAGRRELDALVARAKTDEAFRRALVADLESLEREGRGTAWSSDVLAACRHFASPRPDS